MKITNKTILKTIFRFKNNFSRGRAPSKKYFQGIEIAPFFNNAKAAVCISSDFELNWAFRRLSPQERDRKGTTGRKNVPYILKILEDYRIPITWATVGHLFLESCTRGDKGLAHPDMPRPQRNNDWKGDWYIHDPCTNFKKNPLWYAPDLIEKILGSKVRHEIATHSFSHIMFTRENSNEDLVKQEIEKCALAMERYGLKPRSLVFPRNKMGYLDCLSNLDIIAVRPRHNGLRLAYPERTSSGLYLIYESMNMRSPKYYRYLDKAKIFLEEASKCHAVCHLWFHPSDPTQIFQDEFRPIIKHIADERDKEILWVATMKDIACYCEARESVTLQVQKEQNKIKIYIKNTLNSERFGSPEISLIIPDCKMPRKVTIEFNNDLQVLNDKNYFGLPDDNGLLINVSTDAKLLIIEL